jgi:hypothetical protein
MISEIHLAVRFHASAVVFSLLLTGSPVFATLDGFTGDAEKCLAQADQCMNQPRLKEVIDALRGSGTPRVRRRPNDANPHGTGNEAIPCNRFSDGDADCPDKCTPGERGRRSTVYWSGPLTGDPTPEDCAGLYHELWHAYTHARCEHKSGDSDFICDAVRKRPYPENRFSKDEEGAVHFENLYLQCKCQPIICEYTCSLKGSPELPECNGASATESARALSSEPLDPPPQCCLSGIFANDPADPDNPNNGRCVPNVVYVAHRRWFGPGITVPNQVTMVRAP